MSIAKRAVLLKVRYIQSRQLPLGLPGAKGRGDVEKPSIHSSIIGQRDCERCFMTADFGVVGTVLSSARPLLRRIDDAHRIGRAPADLREELVR